MDSYKIIGFYKINFLNENFSKFSIYLLLLFTKNEQKNKKHVKVVLNQKAVILNLTLLINSLTNPFQVISSSVFITFP